MTSFSHHTLQLSQSTFTTYCSCHTLLSGLQLMLLGQPYSRAIDHDANSHTCVWLIMCTAIWSWCAQPNVCAIDQDVHSHTCDWSWQAQPYLCDEHRYLCVWLIMCSNQTCLPPWEAISMHMTNFQYFALKITFLMPNWTKIINETKFKNDI